MENNNEGFDEKASLMLIAGMISKAQNRFQENGFLYLLWGWTILICSLFQFVLVHWGLLEHPERIWAVTWVVLIFQAIYLVRKKRRSKVRTYTGEIIGYVWLVFVICSMLCSFLISLNNAWQLMYPVLFVTYGIPTFLSGIIMRFRPLVVGAVACWVLSIVAAYCSLEYHLLLLSAAMIIAWIIPGYMMQAKFKSSINQ